MFCFPRSVKKIRGRLRVYVHITVEGKAISKRRKDSTPRHYYGKGNIGCDIGTQTIAYTSNTEVGLENLAERGNSIQHVERQEALILRAMERSRRAMNPNHYNENGTVKKGHKQWNFSKRYQKLRQRHQELCRIAAENRALAIREQVNHLRSLGDCFITEPPNAKKLQKRANPENPVDKNGRNEAKKAIRKIHKKSLPRLPRRQKQSSFLNQPVGCMLRYRFYIVPVSTITHQIVTFQRNCHSECIIWQMGQKFKETGIPLTYCIVSIKLIHRSTN